MLLGANNVGTDVIRRVGRYRQVVYYKVERTCAGCVRESEHLLRVIEVDEHATLIVTHNRASQCSREQC